MKEVIPLIQFLTEINCIFPIYCPTPQIKSKLFEDNVSCIAIAKTQKFSPITHHIAIKYHHFRHYEDKKITEIVSIGTREKAVYIYTKQLAEDAFVHLRRKVYI